MIESLHAKEGVSKDNLRKWILESMKAFGKARILIVVREHQLTPHRNNLISQFAFMEIITDMPRRLCKMCSRKVYIYMRSARTYILRRCEVVENLSATELYGNLAHDIESAIEGFNELDC